MLKYYLPGSSGSGAGIFFCGASREIIFRAGLCSTADPDRCHAHGTIDWRQVATPPWLPVDREDCQVNKRKSLFSLAAPYHDTILDGVEAFGELNLVGAEPGCLGLIDLLSHAGLFFRGMVEYHVPEP